MKKVLYVSDLDGTLLNSQKQVSAQTIRCLNELIEEGLSFSIATARTPATAQELLAPLHIKEPVVLMNGAVIYDLEAHTYKSVEYIEETVVSKIIKTLECHMEGSFIYTIQNNKLIVYYDKMVNKHQQIFYDERKNKPQKTFKQSPLDNMKEVAYFVFIDIKDKIQFIYEALKDLEGLTLSMYKDIYSEEAYLLEVYSHRATKANAILKLKEEKGFDEIICFGDNLNDLSMFEIADAGYAMGNAVEEVKKVATKVIKSNDEDGVASFIATHFNRANNKI